MEDEEHSEIDLAFIEAVEAQNEELVAQLIKQEGLHLNAFDRFGLAALHYACDVGNFGLAKLLLDHGADPNIFPSSKATPLHLSSSQGHLNCIKLLVTKGANLQCEDCYGCQPLHYAAKYGRIDCIEFYVQQGVPIDVRDKYGWTPLHHSISSIRGLDCIKTLLSHKANKHQIDCQNRSPLDIAQQRQYDGAVALLLG